MADDQQNNSADDQQSDISPSTLFLEMMRRAAREADQPDTPVDEPDPSADADDFGEPDTEEDDSPESHQVPEAAPASEVAPASETEIEVPQSFDSRVPLYQAPLTSSAERQARLEEQRVQRVRRRRERQFRRRVGIIGGFFRTIFVAIFAAALASTIFMWFMDARSITPTVGTHLQVVDSTSAVVVAEISPTPNPVTPNYLQRIGIVSGHRGPENDPGAVCDDGLTENSINFAVAQLVVRNLRERGYSVDLLDEFDPRLNAYHAAAIVSLHSNDCTEYEGGASGFLVSRAVSRPAGGPDDILAECLAQYYGQATQLERRFSLTVDMTDYHTFREIHPLTPAAIVEMGFMHDDRTLLTEHQDTLAEGVVDGIICFLNGENPIARPTPVAVPLATQDNNGG